MNGFVLVTPIALHAKDTNQGTGQSPGVIHSLSLSRKGFLATPRIGLKLPAEL